MLREDEVFRFAVVGLLGISDVQSSIRQLVDAVNELTRTVQKLVEGQEKLWEEDNKIWQEVRRLADGQDRLWEEVKALREGQDAMRTDINKLWEENHRLWEENNKIWQEIRKLTEQQEELRKGQEALRSDVDGLKVVVSVLGRRIDRLSRDVGGLSRSVGLLVERDVRHYLPGWVRSALGINVDRLRRARIEGVGEFDGYAQVDNKVVVAEVKTTLRLRDVENFVNKVNKLRETMAGKEINALIAFVFRARDFNKAVELAKANGVKVIRHVFGEDFEEV